MRVLCAVVVGMAAVSGASAQLLVNPIRAERAVSYFVDPDGLDPAFNTRALSDDGRGGGMLSVSGGRSGVGASGFQQSSLFYNEATLLPEDTVRFESHSEINAVGASRNTDALASSYSNSWFEINETVEYRLTGSIAAEVIGDIDDLTAVARVTLRSGADILGYWEIDALDGGALNIDVSGVLSVGSSGFEWFDFSVETLAEADIATGQAGTVTSMADMSLTINAIPAPGAGVFLVTAGCVASRRRRRSAL